MTTFLYQGPWSDSWLRTFLKTNPDLNRFGRFGFSTRNCLFWNIDGCLYLSVLFGVFHFWVLILNFSVSLWFVTMSHSSIKPEILLFWIGVLFFRTLLLWRLRAKFAFLILLSGRVIWRLQDSKYWSVRYYRRMISRRCWLPPPTSARRTPRSPWSPTSSRRGYVWIYFLTLPELNAVYLNWRFRSYELPIRIFNCDQNFFCCLVFSMICVRVFLLVVYSESTNLGRNFFSIENQILSVS